MGKLRKRAAKLLVTIADAAALFMALLYIVYVSLMLGFGLGESYLNISMLFVTIVYVLFFLAKILYINNISPSRKLTQQAKRVNKYIKYGMKLMNAALVVLSIISASLGEEHILPIIGAVATVLSFMISIAWEIVFYYIKRKVAETITQWTELEEAQKRSKVDFLIESLLQALDSVDINGYGEYVEYGARATEIVAEKLNSARANAQNKRLQSVTPYDITSEPVGNAEG